MSSLSLANASFDRERHLPLLLEADDVEEHIHGYLDRGQLFEIREADTLIGVAVLVADADTVEIWNIALAEEQRGRGSGRRAIELIVTGRVIDAREAERIGLVNQVVPKGTCLQRAIELAQTIATLPQPALRTDLEAARTGLGRPIDDGLRIEAECFSRSISASETFEGLRQFNERDHPDRRAGSAPVTPGLARSG